MARARFLVPLAVGFAGCTPVPSSPALLVTPQAPTTLDDLVVSWAADANVGEGVSYEVRWTVDGRPVEALRGQDTVPASSTAKGQVWGVQVTPENEGKVGEASSASVTVVNTPATASVRFTPSAPVTTDEVEAVLDITDPDGDEVRVRWSWTVDGEAAGFGTGAVPAGATRKGQVWEVSAFLHDGEIENPVPAVADFTVGNTPPSVASATVLPSQPGRFDTLSCEPSGWADDDGDAEAYRVAWLADGTEISAAPTLSGAKLVRGQSIVCRLVPDDGKISARPCPPRRWRSTPCRSSRAW